MRRAAKGMGYQLMVKAALLQIVAIAAANGLLEHRMVRQTSDYRAQTLKSIVEYLNEHFTEQIRLGESRGKVWIVSAVFLHFFQGQSGENFGAACEFPAD